MFSVVIHMLTTAEISITRLTGMSASSSLTMAAMTSGIATSITLSGRSVMVCSSSGSSMRMTVTVVILSVPTRADVTI